MRHEESQAIEPINRAKTAEVSLPECNKKQSEIQIGCISNWRLLPWEFFFSFLFSPLLHPPILWGYTWALCSEIAPGMVRRPLGCQGLNLVWLRARQMPSHCAITPALPWEFLHKRLEVRRGSGLMIIQSRKRGMYISGQKGSRQ